MLAERLEHEWCSLLGIGEQKNLRGSHIILNKHLMVVLCNFDCLISDKSSTHLLQGFSVEAIAQVEGLDWNRVGRIHLNRWELLDSLLSADWGLLVAIDSTESEDSIVLRSELRVERGDAFRFAI